MNKEAKPATHSNRKDANKLTQSKVAKIKDFLAGAHYLDENDSLRDYHAARRILNSVHIKGIDRRIAAVRHVLNPYRVTVALTTDAKGEYALALESYGQRLVI